MRRVVRSLLPFFAVLALAVGVAAGLVGLRAVPDDLPWPEFDHALHVSRDIECADCHQGVEERAAAGVPGVAVCNECHDDPDDSMRISENGRYIHDRLQRGEELLWPHPYELPEHVVFSHRRHVALGEIDCATCHGDIAERTTLPYEPVEGTLDMDHCIECHERKGADTDCFACHR